MNDESIRDVAASPTVADLCAHEAVLDYLSVLEHEFELLLQRPSHISRAKSRGRH